MLFHWIVPGANRWLLIFFLPFSSLTPTKDEQIFLDVPLALQQGICSLGGFFFFPVNSCLQAICLVSV